MYSSSSASSSSSSSIPSQHQPRKVANKSVPVVEILEDDEEQKGEEKREGKGETKSTGMEEKNECKKAPVSEGGNGGGGEGKARRKRRFRRKYGYDRCHPKVAPRSLGNLPRCKNAPDHAKQPNILLEVLKDILPAMDDFSAMELQEIVDEDRNRREEAKEKKLSSGEMVPAQRVFLRSMVAVVNYTIHAGRYKKEISERRRGAQLHSVWGGAPHKSSLSYYTLDELTFPTPHCLAKEETLKPWFVDREI